MPNAPALAPAHFFVTDSSESDCLMAVTLPHASEFSQELCNASGVRAVRPACTASILTSRKPYTPSTGGNRKRPRCAIEQTPRVLAPSSAREVPPYSAAADVRHATKWHAPYAAPPGTVACASRAHGAPTDPESIVNGDDLSTTDDAGFGRRVRRRPLRDDQLAVSTWLADPKAQLAHLAGQVGGDADRTMDLS